MRVIAGVCWGSVLPGRMVTKLHPAMSFVLTKRILFEFDRWAMTLLVFVVVSVVVYVDSLVFRCSYMHLM